MTWTVSPIKPPEMCGSAGCEKPATYRVEDLAWDGHEALMLPVGPRWLTCDEHAAFVLAGLPPSRGDEDGFRP